MHKFPTNTDLLRVHRSVRPSLYLLLTKFLTHIEQCLQKYCETAYSRSGINQMWILKNSKELLTHLKSLNFNLVTSIHHNFSPKTEMQACNNHLELFHSQKRKSQIQIFVTEMDLITVFDFNTLFREVSIGHLQQVRLANRGRFLLRTPGHVPFGTCICSNVETLLS